MKATPVRQAWEVFLPFFVVALIGCTTNITPPSGPTGTEVCFDPAPIRLPGWDSELGDILCDWGVRLRSGDNSAPIIHTDDMCFNIPSAYSVGDEITIHVFSGLGFACELNTEGVQGLSLYGSFIVSD